MKLNELKLLIDTQSSLQTKIAAKKLQLSVIERPDYSCMNTESIQLPETTKSDNSVLFL